MGEHGVCPYGRGFPRPGVSRMRLISTLAIGVLGLGATTRLAAQQDDSQFRWYLGAQGGVMGFGTRLQTRSWIPAVGGSLLVTAKRTGLLIGIDEALGSDELTGYTDVSVATSVRPVNF